MDKEQLFERLDQFKMETPTWGYANSQTRFEKFRQPAAACSIEEKLADAGVVHKYTGCCPTIAVHALWDFSVGVDATATAKLAEQHGVKIGSIHPTLFEDQIYRLGSVCSPDERARQHAIRHVMDCIRIARAVGSDIISLWLPDGTSYPGQDDLATRKQRLHGALRQWRDAMPAETTLLLQYKPFEPALYHSDIADWGMAYVYAQMASPEAKVLVDISHHLPTQNVEHIVSFLLDEDMLGGLHFNDHQYADDDLTIASIDPYATFRIFHEIRNAADLHGRDLSKILYMIDQPGTLKPKVTAMIQAACRAQELYAKACLVDRQKLQDAQVQMNVLAAEQCLQEAFFADIQPLLAEWRQRHHLDPDPLAAYQASGYEEQIAKEREAARAGRGAYAGSA
ncbi:MAG TPA: TIM barrel protein [Tepidisphaeraceae bacterium]|nr:TIM barrel protein [Tepidisphaeraceae bacterium]